MNGLHNTAWLLILSILFSALTFLIVLIILSLAMQKRLIVERRLRNLHIKDGMSNTSDIDKRKKGEKKNNKEKRNIGEELVNELHTAGIMMRAEEFAIMWLVIGFVPSGLIALLTRNVVISGVVALFGIIIPPLYVKKQKKKRVTAFEHQLGDALVTMCNCLKSGLTLGQAFESISTEMSEPISKEFTRVGNEVKYGSTLDEALRSMADRIGSDDLELTVTAISIQRQAGGNMSEILSNIAETIKARVKLKSDVKVATASGRASGIIIGILPLALGLVIFIFNPDYMLSFIDSDIGKFLLGIGAVMEVMGFLMIKKILTIKY